MQDCLAYAKHLLIYLCLSIFSGNTVAADNNFQLEIDSPSSVSELLNKHLSIVKSRDNPRTTATEWRRLYAITPQEIQNLLATEGYFSPQILPAMSIQNGVSLAKFKVLLGAPTKVNKIDIQFAGGITQPATHAPPSMQSLQENWALKQGEQFTQDAWDEAKRQLLVSLLISRYPNAAISNSKATINPADSSASLLIEVDSGAPVQFGSLSIQGLERYPASVVENLNPIKPGSEYNQSALLTFQSRLQESGYFSSVEVRANTSATDDKGQRITSAPILVTVKENQSIKLGLGAGFSTNTGARTTATLSILNLFNRGWRMSNSLKVEQKAQSISSQIRLPTTAEGYRDSLSAAVDHASIEGQATTSSKVGAKRAWGGRKREQYVGANLLTEHVNLDGAPSSSNYSATIGYGITLRRTDHDLSPTRGYLLNVQFEGAPIEQLSSGRFLQTYLKGQTYYPITASTQLIARAELGLVNGKNSAPAAFLFRAGGDQSVRGYAYQSLGVEQGDAIVGGRYLVTGSLEMIQWLTPSWGAAVFFDFGDAANTTQTLNPATGYGLGARWKSPIGPIGADIAYGQRTDEYRMHFNIGVAF
ncbi:MAG: outer membrane protein assembly factor [Betaproteobacteria bacterium HGW-Betaproteobacteria-22]|nr:MAG: outer membrane protein assembly factor [Betaproteobacteria bacterium HGW-Betaproteobacteria-22]